MLELLLTYVNIYSMKTFIHLILLILFASCNPSTPLTGQTDPTFSDNGIILYPNLPIRYLLLDGSYDYIVSSNSPAPNINILYQNVLTEPIKQCSISPSLPPGLTLNQSDCSISGILSMPFKLTTYVLVLTTASENYIGNLNISSRTQTCDSNSSTLTSLHGSGSASSPYIICTSSQFLEYIQKPVPQGYANIQSDLDLGTLNSSIGSLYGAYINGMGHSLSFNINTNTNDVSLFSRIDYSSVSRLQINGNVRGLDRVSLLTNIIGSNNVISNLFFPNNSSISGNTSSIISSYIEPNTINQLSDIIIGTTVSSLFYHPYFLIYTDISDLSTTNILFFDSGNTGSLNQIPMISFANKAFYKNSILGVNNIYSEFNLNYWTFSNQSMPSLIKTRMLIYD